MPVKEVPAKIDVEESEFMKQWRALPRSKRERLTKKQIARFDKPDLMTDALGLATVKEKKQKIA